MLKQLKVLVVVAAVVVAAIYFPAAAAARTLTSSANAKLTLSTGQTLNASGSVALTIQQFNVNDKSIVLIGRVNGTLTANVSTLGTVTATFTNVKVVAQVTNLQANCSAGTLSFNYRVTIPTSGISVTVNGTPVPLRGAVTLAGSVSISTAQIAAISPTLATAVGQLTCDIETLQQTGGSLDAIVADLNAILAELGKLGTVV